jgi:ribonucleotide reductase alpha subunit
VIDTHTSQEENKDKYIKIYSRSNCEYCVLAKSLLKKYDFDFTEVVLDDLETRKQFYNSIMENEHLDTNTDTNTNTDTINSVPQIYFGSNRIGGYTELEEYLRPVFNYNKLHYITGVITRNLNKVIDINFYPTEKTYRSNMLHRPIGIGVQGLADVFALMDLPFDSHESKKVNKQIFETIYHASLETSNKIAIERKEALQQLYEQKDKWDFKNRKIAKDKKIYIEDNDPNINETQKQENHNRRYMELSRIYYSKNKKVQGELDLLKPIEMEELLPEKYKGCYSSFEGSPSSKGILQFDMWNITPYSGMYDWDILKQSIMEHGLRNSLLVAPMPTASTSQILGNNECFEPFTSNIYTRRTLAGEFIIINNHLLRDLIHLGLWNEHLKNLIIAHKGSIQNIDGIPRVLKNKYKISWEIPMRSLIDMSCDRGAYVCQSQSLNLWMENPTYDKLTAMHFYSWSKGLKTGIYYLRTKAKASAQQFTIDPKMLQKQTETQTQNTNIKIEQNNEECLMCSG